MKNLNSDDNLIKEFSLTWTLSGDYGASNSVNPTYSDGYHISALFERIISEGNGVDGSVGACVEALDSNGEQLDSEGAGDPVVCHLFSLNKTNWPSNLALTTWSHSLWNGGEVRATPNDAGRPIPESIMNTEALDRTKMQMMVDPEEDKDESFVLEIMEDSFSEEIPSMAVRNTY